MTKLPLSEKVISVLLDYGFVFKSQKGNLLALQSPIASIHERLAVSQIYLDVFNGLMDYQTCLPFC
jgi:hypothetical protein